MSTLKIVYENNSSLPESCELNFPTWISAKYLRWVLLDGSGNIVTTEVFSSSDTNYTQKNGNYIWFNDGFSATSAAKTITLTVPDNSNWANYKVVCYWADDITGLDMKTDDSGTAYYLSDPTTLTGSYTWSFFSSLKRSDFGISAPTYSNDAVSSLKIVWDGENTVLFPLSDQMDIILEKLGKTSISDISNLYICLYLNKNSYDNSGLYITSGNDFYQCYGQKYWLFNTTQASSILSDGLDVTLTKANGFGNSDFSGAYILISDQKPTINSTTGLITAHPSSFSLKISTELVKSSEIVFTPHATASSLIGEEINTMVDNDATTVDVQVDKNALVEKLKTIEGNDGSLDNFYLRWYVVDADDQIVTSSASLLDNDFCTSATNYGKYWYSAISDGTVDDALKMTFNQSSNLTSYKVVCVLTNTPSGVETLGNYVLTEPEVIAKYTYTFTSIRDLPITPGSTENAVKKVYIKSMTDGDYQAVLSDISNNTYADFKEAFDGKGPNDGLESFYVRWYVTDAQGNVVGTTGLATNGYTIRGNGIYWYGTKETQEDWRMSSLSDFMSQTFTNTTSSTSFLWSQYNVVCVVSDETPVVSDGYITEEPEIKGMYTFKFRTNDDAPFVHYGGYDYEKKGNQAGSDSPFNANGTQKTHEVNYYYFVNGGEEKDLILPFQNYSSSGQNIEPRGYFRWYDWKTDAHSTRLTRSGDRSLLKQLTNNSENVSDYKGWAAIGITANAWQDNIGVVYTAPADADKADWEGDVIACDVSRYKDGGYGYRADANGNKTNWDEPTVNVRYIFHIYSAKKIAADIQAALVENSIKSYEDNEYTTLGIDGSTSTSGSINGGSTSIHLRLAYNDIDRYYFHPLTEAGKKIQIPFVESEEGTTGFNFENEHFSTDLVHATSTYWYIYDSSRDYYTIFSADKNDVRFCEISLNALNSATWYNVSNDTEASGVKIGLGDVFYVVAYLTNSTENKDNICPVANYMCLFQNSKPLTPDEFDASVESRTVEYLEKHYKQATDPMSFDSDNPDMDYSEPTKENNISKRPSKFANRFYGFVYGDQIPDADNYSEIKDNTPLHGEYGLYKSANKSGVSDKASGYRWWNRDWESRTLYDRTYKLSNGAQYGYFLYTDASDESRRLCGKEFDGNLCPGSTFVFSAAVANLTENANYQIELQFKLYGIDDNDNYKLLHSFSTGEFGSTTLMGLWYQIFSKITLQKSVHPENYSRFYLSVDNYCSRGADGADFAIDDIRMYHRAAMVSAIQESPLCEDNKTVDGTTENSAKFKLRMLYTSLRALAEFQDMGSDAEPKTMYYRFVKSDGTPVKTDYNGDGTETEYGTFYVHNSWDKVPEANQETIDGDNYFIIANKEFTLDPDETYYVSVYIPDNDETTAPSSDNPSWGSPDMTCSVYSEYFQLVKQSVTITDSNGQVVTNLTKDCGAESLSTYSINAVIRTTDQEIGGSIDLSEVPLDWFIGSASEFSAIEDLQEALANYRTSYPKATTLNTAYGTTNPTYYGLLKKYVDGVTEADGTYHQLLLLASDNLTNANYTLKGGSYTITVIPVSTEMTVGSVTYKICPDPMDFTINVVEDGPVVNLGFSDETYPSDTYYRTVRLGLPQLEELKESGGVLKLPIHSVELMGTETEGKLNFNVDNVTTNIVLTATNDPTYLTDGELSSDKTNVVIATITGESMAHNAETLDIKFNDDILTMLHEGYYYEVMFTYKQETENTTLACAGETYFRINVVPEYVTWNPTADDGLNNNWNNDTNWMRSSAAELYKSATDYTDYGTGDYSKLTTQNSFVPMSFTKVTMPTPTGNNPSPRLSYLMKMSNGRLSNLSNDEYPATSEIEYDIMVNSALTGTDYECCKFYGNTCSEIYFKPDAELRQQQYLVYEKAWVEKELELNKWYILGSPLYGTVAGDMYVPYATGQQTTEAFTDITFGNDYSRKLYPFYQKAWDKSDVKEYKSDGSSWGAYDYPSGLTTMPDAINMESLLWSHIYNDVTESYAPTYTDETQNSGTGSLTGFAIKAGDDYFPSSSTTEITNNALIRLPKADDSYTYSGSSSSTTITRVGDRYKMIIAAQTTSTNKAPVKVKLMGNASGDNLYYLTYNPYMATLDMKKFFANTDNAAVLDATSYWVIKDQTVESGNVRTIAGETDGYIAPMQAFFVKASSVDPVITFTTDMTTESQIIKGVTTQAAMQTTLLTLEAENSVGSSTSYLAVKPGTSVEFDETEDAELLYDNLFESVPTVYTVATDQTVSLNALPGIDWVPMGVVCSKTGDVILSVTGLSKFSETLYLYDAATKSYTELNDTETLTIKSNAHGRYFLTTSDGTTGIRTDVASANGSVNCYSPQAGLIVATATADDVMNKVMVYGTDGSMVKQVLVDNEISCNINVPRGIYIVKVMTNGNTEPVVRKLSVR
ncbi:MAG: hypothetical protein Q4D41_10105 [Prevotellaceae bacterium]|nr:hypothetical protein [Prevotellaceae bacterium]